MNVRKLVILLILSSFFVSCAGVGISPADLKSPHARGRYVNRIYQMAYADHIRYANLENLKPEAKKLLNTKREILIQLTEPIYGPIIVLNNHIQTGSAITDEMFSALLDRLLLLETGWYTDDSQAQAFKLTPQSVFEKPEQQTEENLDKILTRTAQQAHLLADGPQAQLSGVLVGALLELAKVGIHALRAMIEQRNWDEAQLSEAYQESWTAVQKLDANTLKVLE